MRIFILVLIIKRFVVQIVNVNEEFGWVLDLARDLWTHEWVLENDLQFGKVLNQLHHIQLSIDLFLGLFIQTLQLLFLFPAAVAAQETKQIRQKQFNIVQLRNPNDVMLHNFLHQRRAWSFFKITRIQVFLKFIFLVRIIVFQEYVLFLGSGKEEQASSLHVKAVFRYGEQEEAEDDHDDFNDTT